MTLLRTQNPAEFLDVAGAFLEAHPRRNNVILVTAATAIESNFNDTEYYVLSRNGEVIAAAMDSPHYHISLAAAADSDVRELAKEIAHKNTNVPGVMGLEDLAAAFAGTWTEATGQEARRAMPLYLYSLEDVLEPARRPEGTGRRASQSDRDVVLPWFSAFARDAGLSAQQAAGAEKGASRLLDAGTVFLWEEGGEPKAMTAFTNVNAAIGRINAVYVPAHLRGSGYAGACVRYVCRYLRTDRGWPFCILFANVEDPAANRLCRRVGFTESYRFQMYDFAAAP